MSTPPATIIDCDSSQAAGVAVTLTKISAGVVEKTDLVVREEPLEIRIRGESIAVTMRTPGHDAELAAGFLLSEAVIHSARDIVEIAYCRNTELAAAENVLNVFLSRDISSELQRLSRHFFVSSSCGLCGKAGIESVRQRFPAVEPGPSISAECIRSIPAKAQASQALFHQTGGLHSAAVFDQEGNLLVLREDIGRHNAVDKALGYCALQGWTPLREHLLWVSGRASFEIVQKALSAGIPIVAAVSAPSSLAVELAVESQQTLIGFLRQNSFNIYSHPERVR